VIQDGDFLRADNKEENLSSRICNSEGKEQFSRRRKRQGRQGLDGFFFTPVDMTAVNSLRFPRKECFLAAGTESEGRQVAGTRIEIHRFCLWWSPSLLSSSAAGGKRASGIFNRETSIDGDNRQGRNF
jgi:hypothetical protein